MHEPSIAQPAAERPPQPDPESADAPTPSDDPAFLQILTTEHWSLLSARGLAYNESFTRASMLLSFIAMSFVALAFLAQATGFSSEFLVIAAIVFAFDLVLGLVTLRRVAATNVDDLRALHGMARIRHGYTQIDPRVIPYFVTPTHDDMASVLTNYSTDRATESSVLGDLLYGLSTSLGLVGLVVTLVAAVLAGVVVLAAGGSTALALGGAAVSAVAVFALVGRWAFAEIARIQRETQALFPAPPD